MTNQASMVFSESSVDCPGTATQLAEIALSLKHFRLKQLLQQVATELTEQALSAHRLPQRPAEWPRRPVIGQPGK